MCVGGGAGGGEEVVEEEEECVGGGAGGEEIEEEEECGWWRRRRSGWCWRSRGACAPSDSDQKLSVNLLPISRNPRRNQMLPPPVVRSA